jgi:DNA-binding GntR family transcriptional regulator
MATRRTSVSPSPSAQDPSEEESQASQATTQILQLIERMELKPGSTVSERELGQLLKIGRAPLREALARVSGMGLLTARTGSGHVIAPITIRQAVALFDLWRTLEALAVSAYADPLVRARASEVPLLVHGKRGSASPGDGQSAAIFFHVGIVALSGSEPLARALPHWDLARLLRLTAIRRDQQLCTVEVHKKLWTALLAGDVELAARLSGEHCDDLRNQVLQVLESSDQVLDANITQP